MAYPSLVIRIQNRRVGRVAVKSDNPAGCRSETIRNDRILRKEGP
jgi:hypothetical protein